MLSKEGAIRLAEKQNQEQQIQSSEVEDAGSNFIVKTLTQLFKTRHTKNKPKVYFLSLVATDAGERKGKGHPTKEHYLFDVASQLELEGYDVTFMSAQDLEKKFYHENPIRRLVQKRLNIYQLVQYLIEQNPGCSYFLDEVPFISNENGKNPIDFLN